MRASEDTPSSTTEITTAVSIIANGGLVAFPTDTLYALGSHPLIESATDRIFRAKGRSHDSPLPLLIGSTAELELVASHVPELAWKLAEAFWPGALTLVLPKSGYVSDAITRGRNSVAVRIPNHPMALELLRSCRTPLTGTSANKSGGPEPVTAAETDQLLGKEVDLILDGGTCPIRQSSTILDISGEYPKILREGAITSTRLTMVCPEIQVQSMHQSTGKDR